MVVISKALVVAATLFEAAVAGSKKLRYSGGYTHNARAVTNSSDAVSVKILTNTGAKNATAPYLYGWMFEDISHSGDGGLYGELLTNRAFEGSDITWGTLSGFDGNSIVYQESLGEPTGPVLTGYKPLGGTRLSLDHYHPISASKRFVLQLDIPTATTSAPVGFANTGWWGIPVSPQTYNVSFWIYPDQVRNQGTPSTSITVSLQSNLTGEIYASTVIPAQDWNVVNWTYVSTEIVSTVTAPSINNTLAITFDSSITAGQTYYFSQVSLFGETFKGYQNGLRKDLAEVIYDIKPKFLRWPGGNNIEGYSIQTRWKWWETIGPLSERWSRPGNWEYWNTNGMGLLEFLEWTEAMEMQNVLAIYSGYSLGRGTGSNSDEYPGTAAAMYPVLQEALDELEFCMGSVNTKWGAKRAEYGHPEPFDIKFVEIGNEDWFALDYPPRFEYLYSGLKAKYPQITFISTAYNENSLYTINLPKGSMWDTHHYEEPHYFIDRFDYWDNWQESTNNTDVTVFIGEYSVISVDTASGSVDWTWPIDEHIQYPRMISAIAEAVYLLGAERNPNVVKLTSYAPSLQNWNWYNWTPNLIAFDADPNNTVCSTSYYLQKLFNEYHGTESLTVTNSKGDFGPLYWGASSDQGKIYLKVVNTNSTIIPLTVALETSWSTVNATIISNPDPNSFNYKNNATAISLRTANLTSTKPAKDGSWTWNVPAYSITVLQFNQ